MKLFNPSPPTEVTQGFSKMMHLSNDVDNTSIGRAARAGLGNATTKNH